MSLDTRIRTVGRDLTVWLNDNLGPGARSAAIADVARQEIAKADATNARALGRRPQRDTFVDGRKGAPLDSVRPDGTILATFELGLVEDALVFISEQLARHAPVRTGRFSASFALYADGQEVDIANMAPSASRYVFLNTQPYSRKIERGQSPQAPGGVFEVVAALAATRFGNSARVSFGFESPLLSYVPGAKNRADRARMKTQPARQSAMAIERDTRVPAIIVVPR